MQKPEPRRPFNGRLRFSRNPIQQYLQQYRQPIGKQDTVLYNPYIPHQRGCSWHRVSMSGGAAGPPPVRCPSPWYRMPPANHTNPCVMCTLSVRWVHPAIRANPYVRHVHPFGEVGTHASDTSSKRYSYKSPYLLELLWMHRARCGFMAPEEGSLLWVQQKVKRLCFAFALIFVSGFRPVLVCQKWLLKMVHFPNIHTASSSKESRSRLDGTSFIYSSYLFMIRLGRQVMCIYLASKNSKK